MATPDDLKSNAEVAQLKAEISETQSELQQTVAAIQDRLSPAHLKDRAATTVREATIRRVQHMMNRGNNAIPLTLMGIGAAWLLANRRSNGRSYRQNHGDIEWAETAEYGTTEYISSDDEFRSPYAGSGAGRTAEWRAAASDRTAAVRDRARRAATRARSRWDTMLDDNPVALGIAALAAGALVGAAIPSTEIENEYIGPARDNAVESARQLAKDAVQKVSGSAQGQSEGAGR